MRGFSLIEAIVYVALLGLLMVGGLLTSYQLLQGSSTTSVKTTVQDEGDFVLRKISWALSGASGIAVPSSQQLTVTRYGADTVYFQLDTGVVEIKEGAGSWLPITTSKNVEVTALQFQRGVGDPVSLTANFSIKSANGGDTALPFTLVRYLRD